MPTSTALDRANWPIGQRVSRKNNADEHGTVIEQNGVIKVRWDGGKTSYFRHGDLGNVQLN